MTMATGFDGWIGDRRRGRVWSLVDSARRRLAHRLARRPAPRGAVDDARRRLAQRLARRPAPSGAVDDPPRRPRNAVVVQTDIVGSTRLVEAAGARYPAVLMRHRALVGGAMRGLGGRFLAHAGDGTLAVFDCADDAIAASVEAQRALAAERWPGGLALRVRTGVHAGEIYEVDGEPVGLTVNQGARIMAAAEPGQVVVSSAAMTAAAPCAGPAGVAAVQYLVADAGWHALRDHLQPVRLSQVVADGLTVVPPAERVIDLTDPADQARGPVTVD